MNLSTYPEHAAPGPLAQEARQQQAAQRYRRTAACRACTLFTAGGSGSRSRRPCAMEIAMQTTPSRSSTTMTTAQDLTTNSPLLTPHTVFGGHVTALASPWPPAPLGGSTLPLSSPTKTSV